MTQYLTMDRVSVFAVATATAVLAFLMHGVLTPSAAGLVSNHLMTLFPAVGGAMAFAVSRRRTGLDRSAWFLLGGWGVLAAAGNAVWSYYELVAHIDPFPSVADAGYLGGNLCAAAAVAVFALSSKRQSRIRTVIDALLIGASVFAVSWTLALRTVYLGSAGPLFEQSVGLAYPVIDVIVVSLIVFTATHIHTKGRSSVFIIGMGLVGWAIADTAFAYQQTIGTFRSGGATDAGWIGGDALIALAALLALRKRPGAEHHDERLEPPAWRVHLPYIVAGAALIAGTGAQIAYGGLQPITLVGLLSVFVLLVVRQFFTVVENQALTINRLRSVDDMKDNILRAVSHELRTPLTFIKGAASFLADGGDAIDDGVRKDMHARLVANADRLEDLLAGLLDLERLTRGLIVPERRATDVTDILCTVAEHVRDADHEIRVRGERLVANVDPSGVERIVDNLIVNAIRHTPPGTHVVAGAERTSEGVVITVEDDGPGLPPDVKDTVFEPFVQSEHSGRGTGIGLSLVAKFAEIHGGRAWTEDTENGGARFRVLLADPGPDGDDVAA